jgi:mannose-6-phosphate isomerase-like protein (cupin superfamily)
MTNRHLIVRDCNLIEPVPTSHLLGLKKVLLSNDETLSKITQIAITILSAGDKVNPHKHLTMEEHYIFLSGKGSMYVDQVYYDCEKGYYFLIPANSLHALEAMTDMQFITIGIAI